MQIPTVQLSEASQKAAKKILNASKKTHTVCEQMQMANYYAFLHSKNNIKSDGVNYAKLLLGK